MIINKATVANMPANINGAPGKYNDKSVFFEK